MSSGSGVLLVDKPAGLSSAAVVARIRKRHGIAKIGHGGTLDPFASGLLVLLVGEGTKIARFLLEGEKSYEAEASTLFETDTEDHTGQRLSPADSRPLSGASLRGTLPQFVGRIRQVPPRYSALKKDGLPYYERARRGEEATPDERDAVVRSLELLHAADGSFRFRVSCGGGTYVRSLARDWARAAGGTAHLTALKRLSSSQFRLEEALSLESLLEIRPLPLIPIPEALAHLPRIVCSGELAGKIRLGHPKAREEIARGWSHPPGFALAMETGDPVAVVSLHHGTAEIERVFGSASP
ncbi:MAG: tRNA pseudouridine(55) synthase TruB [Bdellovibrionales bacterium]|nr:tRNA pseudouridine(55) synthase TruB [Bdellovibrionales bacterium]